MSHKIKKQIRRTMPLFMIFSLIISTTVAGAVFNLDFKIIKTVNEKLNLEISLPEASADTASTTVTVRNAPPEFSVAVAEMPTSSSTSPVNEEEAAYWQTTATDLEGNNYYLIICASDGATATDGGAPTCNAGVGDTFCVSGATASGDSTICTDPSLADPGAETDEWFAFVCDDHATQSDCSASSQGAGDSGSPIYINHEPTFSAIATTDDNKDPGALFTVTASTQDTDTEGGSDEVYINVCSTNDWATSTGCGAATWCTGTSTVDDVSCTFASSTPAADGTYSYYAFVMDWHGKAAPVNGRTTNYTINNVAPSVSNVVINGGDPINVEMKTTAAAWASSTADLYDANGCSDIVNATSSIFLATVAGGLNCSADDNNCYQLVTSECSYIPGSCTNAADTTSSYICSTTIEHYASPSDASDSNPNLATDWRAGMTAIDDNGLKGSATAISGVELISLEALGIDETEIAYGTVKGGQNTGNYNATTTVVNYGNVPIDTEISGSDMDKSDLSDVIHENNQEFDLANFVYGAGANTLSSTTPTLVDTVIGKPTSAADVSDEIYWGLAVPGGTSSGDYAGTNTFVATIDGTEW